jgi:hypothetical protein
VRQRGENKEDTWRNHKRNQTGANDPPYYHVTVKEFGTLNAQDSVLRQQKKWG